MKKKEHNFHYKNLINIFLLIGSFISGYNCKKYSYKRYNKVVSDDIIIEVRFSPKGGCTNLAMKSIKNAKKNIYVQAYYFTSKILADELINAYKRGVDIKILLDKSQLSHKYSKLKLFQDNNIDVYIDKVSGLSHSKTMIIDNNIVLTGSFNWTNAAENKNSENLIWIKSKKTANIYRRNWLNRREKAKIIKKKKRSRLYATS